MTETGKSPKGGGMGWPLAIGTATVILAGLAAGYLDAAAERGHALLPSIAGVGLVLLCGAAAMAFYIRRTGKFWADWSARKKLYWTSLIGAGLLGVVIGVVNPRPYLDAGALAQSSAIALSAAWIVGLLLVMGLYHRAVDDHEERAMLWANSASWYFLFLAAPVWWLLHRGGLVPPIDLVALFFASIIVNAAVWAWLKFR